MGCAFCVSCQFCVIGDSSILLPVPSVGIADVDGWECRDISVQAFRPVKPEYVISLNFLRFFFPQISIICETVQYPAGSMEINSATGEEPGRILSQDRRLGGRSDPGDRISSADPSDGALDHRRRNGQVPHPAFGQGLSVLQRRLCVGTEEPWRQHKHDPERGPS